MDASTETINPTEKILNSIFANTRFESATAPADDEDCAELSLKQLKSALKENLKNSDTLNAVKAHIRKDLIHGLLKGSGKSKTSNLSVKTRMVLSAMHHYMKASGMHGTLSVFMAESGLENNRNVLNEMDIARLFKLHQLRTSYLQAATSPIREHQADGSPLPPSPAPLLEVMFDFCLMAQQECFRDEACQTDVFGPSARELLDLELRGIRKTLSMRQQQEVASPLRTIEERMLAYQRECDERARNEVSMQVQLFKEQELAKLRSEERQRHQQEMLAYRTTVDTDYQQRLVMHLEREHQASKRLQELERSHQLQLHEQRQQLLHQLEVARQHEEALQRKTQLEQEGLKCLEFRLKEASLALQAREQQVLRAEQSVLVQQSECMELAKKAARKELEDERLDCQESKKKVLMERAAVDQEKQAMLGMRIQLDQLQQQMHSLQDSLTKKEVEISALKKAEEFRLAQQHAEEQHIAKLLETIDPTLARLPRAQQVLALLKQSSELQQQLDLVRDGQALLQAIEEKDEEVARLRTTMRESLERWESDRQQLRREADAAREKQDKQQRDMQVMAEQVERMKSLVAEKNLLIDTLSRHPSPASTASPFSFSGGMEGERLAVTSAAATASWRTSGPVPPFPPSASSRLSSGTHAYTIYTAPSWQRTGRLSPGPSTSGPSAGPPLASRAVSGQRRPFSSSPPEVPRDEEEEEGGGEETVWKERFPPRPAYLQAYEHRTAARQDWRGMDEDEREREREEEEAAAAQRQERERQLAQRRQSVQAREAQLQALQAQTAAKREAAAKRKADAAEEQRLEEQRLDREEALLQEAEQEHWLLEQERREAQQRMDRDQAQRARQIDEQRRRLQALQGSRGLGGDGLDAAERRTESRPVRDGDLPRETETRDTAAEAAEEVRAPSPRAAEQDKERQRQQEREREQERAREQDREREREQERERDRRREREREEAKAEEERRKEALRREQQALEEERERARIHQLEQEERQEAERLRRLEQQREQQRERERREEEEEAEREKARARVQAAQEEALRVEREEQLAREQQAQAEVQRLDEEAEEKKRREELDAKELADARAKVLARRKKSAVASSLDSLDTVRASTDSLSGPPAVVATSSAVTSSEGGEAVAMPSFAAPRPQTSTALIFGSEESHENIEVLDDESDEGNRFL